MSQRYPQPPLPPTLAAEDDAGEEDEIDLSLLVQAMEKLVHDTKKMSRRVNRQQREIAALQAEIVQLRADFNTSRGENARRLEELEYAVDADGALKDHLTADAAEEAIDNRMSDDAIRAGMTNMMQERRRHGMSRRGPH